MKSKATINFALRFFIDHVLASYPERVTQQVIIDAGFFYHQLIFCTRNISRIKRGTHEHINLFKETLTSINFPNYLNFNDASKAYGDVIQKIMVAIERGMEFSGMV